MKAQYVLMALMASFAPLRGPVAHEYWLAPSAYGAPAGQTVSVQAFVGSDFKGELKPFAATRTLRIELQDNERRDIRANAVNGDLNLANVTVTDDQGIVVAFESNFIPIELDAEKFDAYLKKEGLDAVLEKRRALGTAAGPGRERYARCAKTWIAGNDWTRLQIPFGMPIEIIPRNNPAEAGTLSVQILYESKPLSGALVKAWNQPLAGRMIPREQYFREPVQPSATARTDQDGIAYLKLEASGEWLVSVVHMLPSSDKQEADWESRWASFTFARGAQP